MLPIMVVSGCGDKLCALLAALALAVPAAAEGRRLEAEVARVESPAAVLDDVILVLDWPEGAETGALEVRARRLRADALGYDLRNPRWRCTLARSEPGWACSGKASAAELGSATLEAGYVQGTTRLSLRKGEGEFALQLPDATSGGTALVARALPAAWLQPLLASAWPEARFTGGTLQADLLLSTDEDEPVRLVGTLATRGLGLDTEDGRIAAAGLGLDGRMTLAFAAESKLDLSFDVAGGEVLVGALYAALPERGATLQLIANGGDGNWTAPRLRWDDPGVLVLQGSMGLDSTGESVLQQLQLHLASDDLARASERYLSGLLGTLGLGGLALSGGLEGTVDMAGGAIQQVLLTATAVDAGDADGRFAFDGLQGRLGWQRGEAAVKGEFHWDGARLYSLQLGAADVAWESTAGRWSLRQPLVVPLHGGTLALERLAWAPADQAGGTPELALSATLADVQLAGLASALDWPPFTGTLSGRIPEVRYEEGVLALDGGLEVQVFDGRIEVGALRMERPFGVAPTLSTDIALNRLDLVPLTEAFGFGRISGRLEGRIAGLRLVDWEPVAFDAALRTSTSAPDKRRISQRAVTDLSSVGGSGIVAGLQAQVLRMFDTFPYEQIGLSCRLDNNVCTMGGLGPAGGGAGGYTIVEGSGLPRITVVGHQRRVDWPVLVARLQAATSGQAPVVQ